MMMMTDCQPSDPFLEALTFQSTQILQIISVLNFGFS